MVLAKLRNQLRVRAQHLCAGSNDRCGHRNVAGRWKAWLAAWWGKVPAMFADRALNTIGDYGAHVVAIACEDGLPSNHLVIEVQHRDDRVAQRLVADLADLISAKQHGVGLPDSDEIRDLACLVGGDHEIAVADGGVVGPAGKCGGGVTVGGRVIAVVGVDFGKLPGNVGAQFADDCVNVALFDPILVPVATKVPTNTPTMTIASSIPIANQFWARKLAAKRLKIIVFPLRPCSPTWPKRKAVLPGRVRALKQGGD